MRFLALKVRSFLKLLRRAFNFTVVQHVIKYTGRSSYEYHKELVNAMGQFSDTHDQEECLTIYVYSGHGTPSPNKGSHYWIHGTADGYNKNIKLDWAAISSAFTSSGSSAGDILFILDSCYPSYLAKEDGPELLAIGDSNSIATTGLDVSFTKTLCKVLKDTNGAATSIANIYSMMIGQNITHMPTHVCKSNQASIVLHKINDGNAPLMKRPEFRVSPATRHWIDTTHVLITVRMREHPKIGNLSMPYIVTDSSGEGLVFDAPIEIHGYFASDSGAVVLVAMPIELWTTLPASDEAYDFVSFVRSKNLLKR